MGTTAKPRPPRGWRDRFIDALSKLGNVRAAAEIAGVARSTAYRARAAKGAAGDKFRKAWDEAEQEAVERLEQEAIRRGVTGWKEPVFGSVPVTGDDGKVRMVKGVIGEVTRYSDRMLELLLKAHRPERFSERYRMEHSGPGGGPIPDDPRVGLADRLLTMVERKEAAQDREAQAAQAPQTGTGESERMGFAPAARAPDGGAVVPVDDPDDAEAEE